MPLITATEIVSIAFTNALDPLKIKDDFISAAETKYLIPVTTQDLFDLVIATPGDYTTLIDDFIKPYLAFAVKYMFYNQLLAETSVFPVSDSQRIAALQEIFEILSIKKDSLLAWLNTNIFQTTPIVPPRRVGGMLLSNNSLSTNSNSELASVTIAAKQIPTDSVSDADFFPFLQFTSGLLKKLSWSSIKTSIALLFGSCAYKNYWSGTQSAYDSIDPKDSNTIYFIEEE